VGVCERVRDLGVCKRLKENEKMKELKLSQWRFLFDKCETDRQRHCLEEIRNLFQSKLPIGYKKNGCIFFNGIGDHEKVATIRLEKLRYHPEIVIKLPLITKKNELSDQSKRYGFAIKPDGNLAEYVKVYQVKKLHEEKQYRLQLIMKKFLEPGTPQDDFARLIKLAELTIQKYGHNLQTSNSVIPGGLE
jgi:hypothetical protein